jgi:flagellar hook protein FlgE
MSVYGALYSGVSGLAANSNALGMIADNITNVNTIGYKSTQARFETLVTDGSNAIYSPGGVKAQPQTLINQPGLLQASDSDTDLGISGAGFFVVSGSPSDNVQADNMSFTRAGSFFPDDEGYLRNTAGLYLKGWPIDADGNIPTNLGDLSTLETIRTSGLTGTAEATTKVTLRANLQSSQTVSPQEATYDPTDNANNLASGNVKPDFERDIEIYDAQGGTHTITMGMLKAGDNTWHVELYAKPASDVAPGPGLIDGQIATGDISFNPDASFNMAGTTASLLSAIHVDWTGSAAPSDVSFNFGSDGKTDGFTQYDSTSTMISKSVNGAVFGNVIGVEIGTDGIVTAKFDNGLVKDVYQLPLATFQNPNGLERRNGNSFTESDQSGSFSLQVAGTGGAGLISPSTLEASTVDLASEFSNLITTQRAYSASTKVITTADQMLDELNNLKR